MGRLIFVFFTVFAHFTMSQKKDHSNSFKQPNKLIWVKSGDVKIGNASQLDAQPFFSVHVKGFWMQKYEVSNGQFSKFVNATNYTTLAEKNGGSYVFKSSTAKDSSSLKKEPWWHFVIGANWKHPSGKNSNIKGKANYPVVHIAYEDALAYCEWAKMRLPTEVEREYAARKNGALKLKNTWQGHFPDTNLAKDGFREIAPIGSFPAGKIGLCDMQGNVWEWCMDPYHQNAYHYVKKDKVNSSKPLVPKYFDSSSPNEETRVIRGGSFLCADNYCCGYQLGRRMRSSVKMSFSHIGFRCVRKK